MNNIIARVYRVTDRLVGMVASVNHRLNVRFDAARSMTDGKTLWIGSIPADKPEFLDVIPGFGIHEASHVAHTDFDSLRIANLDKFESRMQNVVEDFRIEAKTCISLPGAATYIHSYVEYFVAHGQFPAITDSFAKQDFAWVMWGSVLYRLRGHLDQPHMKDMADAARPCLVALLGEAVVAQIDSLTTRTAAMRLKSTQDATALAKKLCALMRAGLKSPLPEDQDQQPKAGGKGGEQQPGDAEGEGQPGSGGGSSDDGEEKDAEPSAGGGDKGDDADDTQGSAAGGAEGEGEPGQPGEESSGGGAGEPKATQGQREDAASQIDGGKEDMPATDIGDMLSKILDKLSREARASGKVVQMGGGAGSGDFSVEPRKKVGAVPRGAVLRQLSQLMRTKLWTQSLAAEEVVRTGLRLRGAGLYRTALGDNRVFNRRCDGRTYDTDLFVLMDRSGSMSAYGRMTMACEAAAALAAAVDPIRGVNCAVATFDSVYSVIKTFEERFASAEQFFNVTPRGGTLTIQSLRKALRTLAARTTRRKMIVLVTDGQESSVNGDSIANVMATARKLGVEVRTIGLQTTVRYEYGTSCSINDVNELPNVLFKYAYESLEDGYARAA